MELTFSCPSCRKVNHASAIESAERVVCAHCGGERPLHREAIDDGGLAACPLCLTTDLYVKKDFPQALGLFLVLVQFSVATVFWYYERPLSTYAVLVAFTLLDWFLYPRVSDVTICYRCSSQVRGPGSSPEHRFEPFELEIGERYRQERIRIEELRKRGASASASANQPAA